MVVFEELVLVMNFGNLVGLLSRSRQFDMFYQGKFVSDFVKALFQRQAWRQSVKIHEGFSSIHSSLSTGFQFYHCKCWVFLCEYVIYDTICFLLCSFF